MTRNYTVIWIIIILIAVIAVNFFYRNITLTSPENLQSIQNNTVNQPKVPIKRQDVDQTNNTTEDTQKQVSDSLILCQQDSDCMLVYPLGNSVRSCCWGCLTFSINKNQKESYDELFNQKCKEIECPPYAPGAACFPHEAVCVNNECQAIPEEI